MKFVNRLGLNLYMTIFFAILIQDRDWSDAKLIFNFLAFIAASMMLLWDPNDKEGKK